MAITIRGGSGGENVTPEVTEQVSLLEELGEFLASKGAGIPQEKEVTAGTSATTVTPDSGCLFASVTVNPTPSQTKTVTPVPEGIVVKPDSGKLLSQVILNGFELPSPEGNCAWKKYEYIPERTVTNPTFKFATISSGVSTIKITSDNVDLTKVTAEFFAGFTFTDTTGTSCNFQLNTGTSDGELIMSMGLSVYLNYDPESTSFVQAGSMGIGTACSGRTATYNGNKTLPAMQGALIDYVVSDNTNEYPDGAEQDGFYYEKVSEGVSGIDYGEVTITSEQSSFTIQHSLGVVPSMAILVPCGIGESNSSNRHAVFLIQANKNIMGSYAGFAYGFDKIATGSTYTNSNASSVTFNQFNNNTGYQLHYKGTYKWIVIA